MTLEKAIAELKYWHERGRHWPGDPATVAEVIITAAASGDLIPLADHRLAVALVVQKAAVYSVNEARTLALADADALAEVQALRREIEVTNACNNGLGRLNDVVRKRAEAAEAEVARLREALTGLMCHEPDHPDNLWSEARAALQPKAAT